MVDHTPDQRDGQQFRRFYPWVRDLAGNVSSVYASPQDVYIDTTPPDTSIDSETPSAASTKANSMSISFRGSDNIAVASFVCSLDGADFSACVSPWSAAGLSDGSHTFKAAALDTAGNTDPSPVSYTWQIDNTGPSVVVSAATSSPSSSDPLLFTAIFSEPVTGFEGADVSFLGTAGATTATVAQINPAEYQVSVTGMAGIGTVGIAIAANTVIDLAGNGNLASTGSNDSVDFILPTITVIGAATPSESLAGQSFIISYTVAAKPPTPAARPAR